MAENHHGIRIPGYLPYFTDVSPSTQTCGPVEGVPYGQLTEDGTNTFFYCQQGVPSLSILAGNGLVLCQGPNQG